MKPEGHRGSVYQAHTESACSTDEERQLICVAASRPAVIPCPAGRMHHSSTHFYYSTLSAFHQGNVKEQPAPSRIIRERAGSERSIHTLNNRVDFLDKSSSLMKFFNEILRSGSARTKGTFCGGGDSSLAS